MPVYVRVVEWTPVVLSVPRMENKKEQRYRIQFCVRLGKTLQETLEMLHQVYTNRCLCDRSILWWHTAFMREGCQSAELIPHDGRPAIMRTEVNVDTVAVAIREECHSSTRKLAKLLNISRTSVNRILTENLAMRKVLSVWVPHFLTNVQMNDCIAACQENLGLIEDISYFLDHVIICDES